MSGGAYDFGHFKVQMLAEEMEEDLKENSIPFCPEDTISNEKINLVLNEIKKTIKELKFIAEKARVIDFLVSGDYVVETFLEEIDEIYTKYEKERNCIDVNDIRNKLGPINNLITLLKNYKGSDSIKKFKFIQEEIKNSEKSIKYLAQK